MKVKKLMTVVLAVALMACFTGCKAKDDANGDANGETKEVIVFAAASMTETLNEVADMYRKVDPNVNLTFSFASSGDLKTQIEEGAACDLFISAGQPQMDELDVVDEATRINLLENKVVLCVPKDAKDRVENFDDLAAKLKDSKVLLAMGNSDVPVGQYTQKILAYYNLDEATLAKDGKLTYGSDVKEVTTQVVEGSVDCGVVYGTDAHSAGLTPVDFATKEMCGQVIYPAAVLKTSKQPEAAKAFLDYLSTDEAMEVFEKVGFSKVK